MRLAALLLAAAVAFPLIQARAEAPGDIYLGYYREDPATNPEDPTIGALYLTLPKSDEAFSGAMFFTYVGCQSSNVGRLEGRKSGAGLAGEWSGTVDGTAQHGHFSGSAAAEGVYAGVYDVAGGKQHVEIPNCISYYIAPKGTFELFVPGRAEPAGTAVSLQNGMARWPSAAGAVMTLVFVLDADKAAGTGNAVVWQTLLPGNLSSADLAAARLKSGGHYVLAVASVGGRFERLSFASTRFTQP